MLRFIAPLSFSQDFDFRSILEHSVHPFTELVLAFPQISGQLLIHLGFLSLKLHAVSF